MSVNEAAADVLADHGVDLADLLAEAVAADRARITEAMRGSELPSNWSRFKGGALWDEARAAFLAIVDPQ